MPHRAVASLYGDGAPTTLTPEFEGQIYRDELNNECYISRSKSQGDWDKLLTKNKTWLQFGVASRCSGEIDLEYSSVGTSRMGFIPINDCKLTKMCLRVNKADGSRDYQLRFTRDPSGTNLPLATLDLKSGDLYEIDDSYDVSLSNSSDYGLFLNRISGTGDSDFEYIIAMVEIQFT